MTDMHWHEKHHELLLAAHSQLLFVMVCMTLRKLFCLKACKLSVRANAAQPTLQQHV